MIRGLSRCCTFTMEPRRQSVSPFTGLGGCVCLRGPRAGHPGLSQCRRFAASEFQCTRRFEIGALSCRKPWVALTIVRVPQAQEVAPKRCPRRATRNQSAPGVYTLPFFLCDQDSPAGVELPDSEPGGACGIRLPHGVVTCPPDNLRAPDFPGNNPHGQCRKSQPRQESAP